MGPAETTVNLPFKRPTTAAAFGFEEWAKREGAVYKNPRSVKRGDVVVYSFSHIGIADSDSDKDGSFTAREGNTNVAGGRECGAVLRKVRKMGLVRSSVRIS